MRRAWLALAACCPLATATAPAAAQPKNGVAEFGPEILQNAVTERHADQGILRPVPIVVVLPPQIAKAARRVLVHYRLWGEPDWTTIELRDAGGRFVGAIPCLQVSTVTGDLRYYLRIHDGEGRVIATGAARGRPYLVTIRNDAFLSAEKRAAKKCPDPADCPPGLLGCPSARVIRVRCYRDDDCEEGQSCGFSGFCEKLRRRKNWLSLSIEQDLGAFGATGACSAFSQQHEGYGCYRADGQQYDGNPIYTDEPAAFGVGPTRIVIGYDRLLAEDLSLGARLGFAFLGRGPTPPGATAFVPISAAARLTHWFGADPFGRAHLRPFAFATAGYAMFDLRGTAHVREDPHATSIQGGNDLEQRLELDKRAGDGFVGAGGGLGYELGEGIALSCELGLLGVVPFGALVMAPSVGLMVGF